MREPSAAMASMVTGPSALAAGMRKSTVWVAVRCDGGIVVAVRRADGGDQVKVLVGQDPQCGAEPGQWVAGSVGHAQLQAGAAGGTMAGERDLRQAQPGVPLPERRDGLVAAEVTGRLRW